MSIITRQKISFSCVDFQFMVPFMNLQSVFGDEALDDKFPNVKICILELRIYTFNSYTCLIK